MTATGGVQTRGSVRALPFWAGVALAAILSVAAWVRLVAPLQISSVTRRVRLRHHRLAGDLDDAFAGIDDLWEATWDIARREIDEMSETEICASFGMGTKGKRTFVADPIPRGEPRNELYHVMLFTNEFHTLYANIYETYPYVDKYIIIEGDVTTNGTPRQPTWPRRKEILGEDIFAPVLDRIHYIPFTEKAGANAEANIGLSGADPHSPDLGREGAMRNHALYAFLEGRPPAALLGSGSPLAGLPSPINASQAATLLVGDADEISSRRFVRFLKSCDVWALGPYRVDVAARKAFPSAEEDREIVCPARGKLIGRIPFFEGYLDCPVFNGGERKEYWHPDMIPLPCLNYYKWTPNFVREWEGPPPPGSKRKKALPVHWFGEKTGYHLRNFLSVEQVKQKFRTYGHPTRKFTVDHIKNQRGDTRKAAINRGASDTAPGDVPLLMAHDRRGLFADYWYGEPPAWYTKGMQGARGSARPPGP